MRLADGSSTTAGDGRASRLIGNMMRLANDSAQPNLKLLYWPPPQRGGLPRRAFLVATADVPAYAELTWSYGQHYPRPWLPGRGPGRGDGKARAMPPAEGVAEGVAEEAEGLRLHLSSSNATGYKGVYRLHGRFHVQHYVDGRCDGLGCFDTAVEAAVAYARAAAAPADSSWSSGGSSGAEPSTSAAEFEVGRAGVRPG